MNISSSYSATNSIGYSATKNAPQTSNSSKSFTIPTQEMPKVNLQPIRPLTFVGYDEFNPFEDISKTGSFSLPKLMQTKTEPTRSDEEILKDMEELAKEHARTGVSNRDDKRFAELINEYVSSVSPDRESILKSKVSEILERMESEGFGISGAEGLEEDKKKNKELVDYFMEVLGVKKEEKNDNDIISNNIAARGNNIVPSGNNIIATRSDGYYTQVDYDRGGGNVTSLIYDNNGNLQPGMVLKGDKYDGVGINNGVVESGNFYDDSGELIMNFLGGKLSQSYTKAEGARLQEIVSKYSSAYEVASGRA